MIGKKLFALAAALALSGCMTAQEREAELARKIDAQDDGYCRAQGAIDTNAYTQCRARLLQARQIEAANDAREAEALDNLGTSMQRAGVALQNINPPQTVCTSTPWLNGVRTTCD